MSDEIKTDEVLSTEAKAVPQPTHAEMFFRYIAAIAQVAGVQAFTLAVAVPKEDGTSAVMSVAAGSAGTSSEWQVEISKLLADSAAKATATIVQPEPKAPEVV